MLQSLPPLGSNKNRGRYLSWALFVGLVSLLFFGGAYLLSFFSPLANTLVLPLIRVTHTLADKASLMSEAFFSSPARLAEENQDLRNKLETMRAEVFDRDMLLDENRRLREVLGRREEEKTILANVLSKPNRSPYDTLIIDIGANQGLETGDYVLGLGSVVIGRVAVVYESSSLVKLFSSPGEEQEVVIGTSTPGKAIGVGGGNFRIILPKGVVVSVGDSVIFPSVSPRIFGRVEKIESDSSDTFERVLFQSPVNLFELRWVEILKK